MLIGTPSYLVVVILLYSSRAGNIATAKPQVPCYFVFGDSLSDSGNNNHLQTPAKANFKPYGVDFPGGRSTGRFTNNKTFVDVITELLGFDHFIPPFNKSMGVKVASEGVNYASGGAGILYETGQRNLGEVISFDQQIKNHETIVAKISKHVNLSRCVYNIHVGSNDYINNYFNSQTYPTSQIFTPTTFASYLIRYYRAYVKQLHGLGARKMAFYLLGRIGCALAEIAAFGTEGCVESINNATAIFDKKLVSLVRKLNRQLPGAHFIYFNSTAIETSAFKGVTVFNASCCTPRSDGQCQSRIKPCSDRSQYYFWDLFHPTEAVTTVIGRRAYKAHSTKEAHPFDISHLARI